MIVQFQGETRYDAIVNHFSLDLEDEGLFFTYLALLGYSIDDADELIEAAYQNWLAQE